MGGLFPKANVMVSIPNTPAVVRENGDPKRQRVSYGWFSFRRTGVLVPFKGALAHDALTVFAVDPDVFEMSKTVPKLQWFDGCDWTTHRPRYAIHSQRRPFDPPSVAYVDVEWSWDVEAFETKFERLRRDAAEKNLDYRVFTEKDVRVEPRLINAKTVQKFAGSGVVAHGVVAAVSRFADGRDFFSVNEAVDAGVADYPDAYAGVLHLVAHGRMTFDLGRRFDGLSAVAWRRF